MQAIFYMIRKEFRQIFRTREMLAIIFIVPLIQMLILGFAITNEVKHVKLIIADLDNSSLSREIIAAFQHTDRFKISGYTRSIPGVTEAIKSWDAQAGLIIPARFAKDVQRGHDPQLQLVIDGVDGNTASVALGYTNGILRKILRNYLAHPRNQQFVKTAQVLEMQERMFYNLELDNAQFMIPGIVVALLTMISMMLSAMGLVREKEIGTLEQLLVSPLKKHQLLLGKILPFLILAFIELGIVLKTAQLIFSVEMQGSYFLLAGLSFLYLFTTLGLGILVSTITHSQQQAMFVSWFIMVFMLLMSGFFVPIANMPEILQKITYLNPMRYFVSIVRDIFQKGAGIQYLLIDIIPLIVFGGIIFGLSIIKFQKRIN